MNKYLHNKKYLLILMICLGVLACKNNSKEPMTVEDSTAKEVALEGREVTYNTDSTQMKGYIVYDKNITTKRPGIVVVHEWWGHNDYTRDRANMLAALGYTALAIDMYGNGKQAAHPQDAGKFSGMVMQNIDEAKARFDAALEVLKSDPSVDKNHIAAIGYCFGGSVVLTMANTGADLDAAAAFHSGLELPIMPNDKLKAKVLVANGADDPFISEASVVNFKKSMDSIHADYEYVAYPGARHAYSSKGATDLGIKFNLPLEYNAEADAKSWDALQKLLDNTFNK